MKRIGLAICILLAGLVFATHVSAESAVSGYRIVIDAGHGGTDPGSTECAGYYESDANLDIAYQLKALLEADGATVYMTRTDDSSLSNNDRYTFANSTDGEVLVSIHLNGSTDHSVNGTLGLYGKRNKDLAFTEVMHEGMATTLNVQDLGVTNFASGVLLKSNMPATIQESVFISSAEECAWLTDGSGDRQQEIAQALYDGLSSWFSQSQPPPDGGGGNNGGNCPPNSNKPQCR